MILSLAMLLLLASCQRSDRDNGETTTGAPNQARVTITLQVNNSLPPAATRAAETPPTAADSIGGGVVARCTLAAWEQTPTTKSTPTTSVEESAIHDLWALQFDEAGQLVGNPVYQAVLKDEKQVVLMLTQTPGEVRHTVYFVTNTGDKALFSAGNASTVNAFKQLMHNSANEVAVTAGGVLMMTGSYTGQLKDKGTIGGSGQEPISMTRVVAKVAFNYNTGAFIDGTLKVLSVQLKSAAVCSFYLPPTGSTSAYPVAGNHADYAPEASPNETTGSYTWYLPENVRGTAHPAITWEGDKGRTHAPDEQATFIEVRAKATPKVGVAKNVRFLFYLGADINEYSIRRNTGYTLDIDFRGIDENDQRVETGNSTPWLASSPPATDVYGTVATVHGIITSNGGSPILTKGFYLSTNKNDIGVEQKTGIARGYEVPQLPLATTTRSETFEPVAFESTLTGLANNTTYYVRAYATNESGSTMGEQVSFTTTAAPTVATGSVTGISYTSAKVGISSSNTGGSGLTEQGVVYAKSEFNLVIGAAGVIQEKAPSVTDASVSLPNLTPATTYYVRAYATNTLATSYGKVVKFATLDPPTFKTVELTEVKGLNVKAKVAVEGNETPVECGVVFSTSPISNPADFVGKPAEASGIVTVINASATWYLYPYVLMNADETPFYGKVQYNHSMMPTPAGVTAKADVVTGDVIIEVTAQVGTVLSRGYCYYQLAGFDPPSGVLKDEAITGTSEYTETIKYGTLEDGKYYIRTYAVNTTGKSYSVVGEFEVKKTLPKEIIVGGIHWAPGNLYYDSTDSQYKNASTQEYVHKVDYLSIPPKSEAEGGAYFGWNTEDWKKGTYNSGTYTPKSDPCTLVNSEDRWVTPTKSQFDELAPFKESWMETKKGYTFTDPSTSNTLFLPAAGYRFSDGSMNYEGKYGFYWSRTPTSSYATYLYFSSSSSSASIDNNDRKYGFSVRCVKGTP